MSKEETNCEDEPPGGKNDKRNINISRIGNTDRLVGNSLLYLRWSQVGRSCIVDDNFNNSTKLLCN